MKKIIITLAIITAGIALLFAQTPDAPKPQAEAPAPAPAPALVASQQAPPEPVVQSAPEPAEPASAPVLPPEVKTDEVGVASDLTDDALITDNRISLLMKNAELEEVIEVFSRLSNANIIVPDLSTDKKIDRKMDVNLNNVEWKPALEAVLEAQNLELYEKVPGSAVYSIREKVPGAPEPTEMRIFKLNYASANSVTNLLAQMVGATGSYSIFPERNVVMAQAVAKKLQNIGAMIEQIDLPRQQVFIEAKFMELSDSATKKLGIDWKVLGGYNVGLKGIGGNYAYTDSKNDGVDNTQSSGGNLYTDIAGRSYEKLEAAPDQSWVENENNPANFEWDSGVDYDPRPGSAIGDNHRIFGIVPTTFSGSENKITSLDEAIVRRALGATLSAADFGVVLAALNEVGGAKVVSNPKVIVANEETAMIHIGNKKPNVKGSIQTAGDSQLNRTYALDELEPYFEDGIKVLVTPTVNTASNITVKIQPTLDRLDAVPFIAPDGTEFYGKSTKTINTLFSLESGQTAAIGGLTKTSSDSVDRKIPFLGTLPLVGRFFSYEETIDAQVETIIFVTVGLANPEHIDMDTGLPTGARLTQRHQIQEAADRRIEIEKRNLFQVNKVAETEEELEKLRAANQKLIEKKEAEKLEAAEKEAEAIAPIDPSVNFSSDLPSVVQGMPQQDPVIEKDLSIQKIIESLSPETNSTQ